MNKKDLKIIKEIAGKIKQNGGKAVFVGGMVRDQYLNSPCKDIDIEVFGLKSFERLKEILSQYGAVNEVGKSFAVLKLKLNQEIELCKNNTP